LRSGRGRGGGGGGGGGRGVGSGGGGGGGGGCAGLSPRVPGFDRRPGSMGFLVDKVALSLIVFWVSTVIIM